MKQSNKNKVAAIISVMVIMAATLLTISIVNNIGAIVLLSCLTLYMSISILDDAFNSNKDEEN